LAIYQVERFDPFNTTGPHFGGFVSLYLSQPVFPDALFFQHVADHLRCLLDFYPPHQ
jgi:hypothetical protein